MRSGISSVYPFHLWPYDHTYDYTEVELIKDPEKSRFKVRFTKLENKGFKSKPRKRPTKDIQKSKGFIKIRLYK